MLLYTETFTLFFWHHLKVWDAVQGVTSYVPSPPFLLGQGWKKWCEVTLVDPVNLQVAFVPTFFCWSGCGCIELVSCMCQQCLVNHPLVK